jgi:hypothetical protein
VPEYQERGILDPISEDPANLPLEVTGGMAPNGVNGHAIGLREWNFPRPEMVSNFVSTLATEGEKRTGAPRFGNRKIPVEVYIAESQGVDFAGNYMLNPSFEKALTGWSAVSSATLARVLGGIAGEYALDLATTSTSGSGVTSDVLTTAVPSIPWVASCWVKAKTAGDVGKIIKLQLAEYTNTPTLVGTTVATATLTSEWQRVTVSRTFGGTGNKAAVLVTNNSAQAVGVLCDGFQLEQTQATYYFDGDTPGCLWYGTPHASTCGRNGLNRKRFLHALYDLESKIEKLARSGGTFKRYLHDGTAIVFDVIEATFTGDWNPTMAQGQNVFSFELTCKPAARLAPITFPLRTKAASKSILSAVEGPVPGNFPALGKLEITDTGTANRNFLLTALSSARLDTAAPAEIEFLAKNLTPMSGAALANSPGTAGNTNGGATNGVVTATMTDGWAPYLSGKTLGGVYPTHQGSFRVWARIWLPTGNSGEVQVRLDYSGADLTRWVTNDPVTIPADTQEGAWDWVDLGVVRLEPPQVAPWGSSGAWRWEPRIAAKSTVPGDTISIDTLDVFPVDEFYAEARPNPQPLSVGGGLVARGFGTAADSALSGRTAQLGGNWSGTGSATDFSTYSTGAGATRSPSATEALWAGRFARLGVGTQAGINISGDVDSESKALSASVTFTDYRYFITRYTDANNFVYAGIIWISNAGTPGRVLVIGKRVAGVTTTIASKSLAVGANERKTLSFTVLADGSTSVSYGTDTLTALPDSQLATGGVRETGGYGIYHGRTWTGTPGFLAPIAFLSPTIRSIVTSDAPPDLVLASGRKAFITHDRSLRQSADGTVVGEIGKYEGDRLLVPCSGPEGRSVRWALLDSRVDPDNAADSNLDTLTGQLTVIPRVTDVPEPS